MSYHYEIIFWIAIKPCRCEDQFYQRWKMLMTNLLYVGALFNPFLFGEVHPHNDANVKEALNIVLQKIVGTLTTYALVLKDFANCVESRGPFFDTPLVKDLALLQIMIFSTKNFDQKVCLSNTNKKNHLSHFGQVVLYMTNLIGGLFD